MPWDWLGEKGEEGCVFFIRINACFFLSTQVQGSIRIWLKENPIIRKYIPRVWLFIIEATGQLGKLKYVGFHIFESSLETTLKFNHERSSRSMVSHKLYNYVTRYFTFPRDPRYAPRPKCWAKVTTMPKHRPALKSFFGRSCNQEHSIRWGQNIHSSSSQSV
jgi:hypothetical protein